MKNQLNNIRQELTETIREAVAKENNCIGTFYRNRGDRYFVSLNKEEYDDSPIVVFHNPDFNTYGGFDAATVFDLYIDSELFLKCTLNGESGEDWDESIENVQVEGLVGIVEWLQENGFIPGHSDNPCRCANCGSTHVQRMAWVRPNENNKCVDFCSDDDEDGDNWCDDCEEHSDLIPEDELLVEIDEWWSHFDMYSKERIAKLWLLDYYNADTGETDGQDFKADCMKFWNGLSKEQKIETWKSNKKD
jgi:hypothetical protein